MDGIVHGSLGQAHEVCEDRETVSFCVTCFMVFFDSFVESDTLELMAMYFRKSDGSPAFEFERVAPIYDLTERQQARR